MKNKKRIVWIIVIAILIFAALTVFDHIVRAGPGILEGVKKLHGF